MIKIPLATEQWCKEMTVYNLAILAYEMMPEKDRDIANKPKPPKCPEVVISESDFGDPYTVKVTSSPELNGVFILRKDMFSQKIQDSLK